MPLDSYKRSFVSGDPLDCIKAEYYYYRENGHFFAKAIFSNGVGGPLTMRMVVPLHRF